MGKCNQHEEATLKVVLNGIDRLLHSIQDERRWDGWKDASGNWIKTCSILTTAPNAVAAAVHDRMPVILDPDGYDMWLDRLIRASEMRLPYDARRMRCYPVSTRTKRAPQLLHSHRFRIVSSSESRSIIPGR